MLKTLRLDLDLDLLELIRKTVCDTGDGGDKLELDKPAANMQVRLQSNKAQSAQIGEQQKLTKPTDP